MAQQNVRGVNVDSDARRKADPVTIVVWPSGMEQDADNWSDANNYLSAGAGIKAGYPTGPQQQLNENAVAAPGNEPEPRQTRPSPARPTVAPPAAPASS